MKVLYVTNTGVSKNLDHGYLSRFAEKEDILYIESVDEARNYILYHLVGLQEHIDFIMVDLKGVDEEVIGDFAYWIILQETEYSQNNFRLSSIPLILVRSRDYEMGLDESISSLYTKIFNEGHDDTVKQEIIGTAISQWMQKIGDDLAYFNMDLKLQFDSPKLKWLLSHRTHKLKVLTETFFRRMKKLPYIWFGENLKTFDISLNTLYDLLKKAERFSSLRNEKEIHRYLLSNLRVLLGEFYELTRYEMQYYLPNSRQYVEPDFTNMAYSFYHQNPEIFEVKLPSQKLVRKDKKIFYRNTTRALNQVTLKYAGYFSDPLNIQEISRRIGYDGNHFNYTLLIGRKREKEENEEYLSNFLETKDVKVITYDELPENFQRLYERTLRFRLS